MVGSVKWFSDEKGFGFIKSEDLDKDIFVHYSKIQDSGNSFKTLQEGQEVEFDVEESDKGLRATRVIKVR